MSLPTPNYVITETHTFTAVGGSNSRTLPAGAFVRPIEVRYLPKHILDRHRWYNIDSEVFVFTAYGIILIPRSIMREA
jgi:hypothetical protein